MWLLLPPIVTMKSYFSYWLDPYPLDLEYEFESYLTSSAATMWRLLWPRGTDIPPPILELVSND
jgi:hypothetical protein